MRDRYGRNVRVTPLHVFRRQWWLPEYRFRFRIVLKGTFFSILPVFAIVRPGMILTDWPQVVSNQPLATR